MPRKLFYTKNSHRKTGRAVAIPGQSRQASAAMLQRRIPASTVHQPASSWQPSCVGQNQSFIQTSQSQISQELQGADPYKGMPVFSAARNRGSSSGLGAADRVGHRYKWTRLGCV
eukprot:365965-Chlamydomonas_euryale.AAC.12